MEMVKKTTCHGARRLLQKITFPFTIELFRLEQRKGNLWRRKKIQHMKWMCKYIFEFDEK